MKLTVIGCAGSFPGPDSPCSCYLIEADGFRLLLDFGSGSLGALQRYADPYSIDAILLTHLHADHIMDACPYVVMRRYAPGSPFPQLPVHGPDGTEQRLVAAYGGAGETACPSLSDVYEFHTLTAGTFTIGPFRIDARPVCHPIETYGIRVEHGGSSLAYSSDTGPCASLEPLARNSDVFLCEASYLEGRPNPPGVHLTGREAGHYANLAGANRLLLTHLVQRWGDESLTLAEAQSAFPGKVDIVHSGDIYEI